MGNGPRLTDPVLDEPEDIEDIALGDDYALSAEFVDMVIDAADRGDTTRLRGLVDALRPEDIADLMGFLSAEYREEIIPLLDSDDLADILADLDTNLREEILESIEPGRLAAAMGELDSDDAADVIDDMEDGQRAEVLAAMSEIDRAAIETTLSYADETAGRLMQREALALPQFWTVGQAIDYVRQAGDSLPDLFFEAYLVDPSYHPVGAVPVSVLLRAPLETPLAEIMEPETVIPVDMDQEEVAYIFDKYHLISAPVVEPGGRLVGQITVDDIVGVIQDESEEDILALAGVSDVGRDATILDIVKSRLPWLAINLVTEAIAVTVIGPFQSMVAQITVLVMLMPIVSSLGGNAGTQALTVAVRAIASRELNAANAMRIIARELVVGIANGAAIGLLLAAGLFVWQHDWRLSLVVLLAIIANLFVAAVGGILAPIVLDKFGRDPAVSSSVVVTFMTDFFGFLALLAIAALILIPHH
jgi:magnesium transporter